MIDPRTIQFIEERLDERIEETEALAETNPSRLSLLRGKRDYVLKETKRVPLHREYSTHRRVFDLCRSQASDLGFSLPEPFLLEPEGRFMVMEFIEGDTLLNRLRCREPEVEDLFRRVGIGLRQFHEFFTERWDDAKTDLREYPYLAEVLAGRHGSRVEARLSSLPMDSYRILYKDMTPANVLVSRSDRIFFVDVQEALYVGPFYYDLARFVDTTIVFSVIRGLGGVWRRQTAARRAAAAFLEGYGQGIDRALLATMQSVHRSEHVHIKRSATPGRALVLKLLYTVLR